MAVVAFVLSEVRQERADGATSTKEKLLTEPAETDAVLAGADVESISADQPEQAEADALDEQALAAVRESLPEWDVQPFQLSRAVDVAGGTDALRTSLEHVSKQLGRAPELLVTGDHLVVRIRTEGVVGVTAQDVDLAAALNGVFSGSHATESEPGER